MGLKQEFGIGNDQPTVARFGVGRHHVRERGPEVDPQVVVGNFPNRRRHHEGSVIRAQPGFIDANHNRQGTLSTERLTSAFREDLSMTVHGLRRDSCMRYDLSVLHRNHQNGAQRDWLVMGLPVRETLWSRVWHSTAHSTLA